MTRAILICLTVLWPAVSCSLKSAEQQNDIAETPATKAIERLVVDCLRAWEENDTAFLERALASQERKLSLWGGGVLAGRMEWRPLDSSWCSIYATELEASGTSGTVEVVCPGVDEDSVHLQRLTIGVSEEEGRWRVDNLRFGPGVILSPSGGEVPSSRVWPDLDIERKPYKEAIYCVYELMQPFFTTRYYRNSLRKGLAVTTAWPEDNEVSTTGTTEQDKRLLYEFVGLHERAKIFRPPYMYKVAAVAPEEHVVSGVAYLHGGGDLCVALYDVYVIKVGGMWLADKLVWHRALPLRPPKNWREKLETGDCQIAFPADSPRFGGLPIFLGEFGDIQNRQNRSKVGDSGAVEKAPRDHWVSLWTKR